MRVNGNEAVICRPKQHIASAPRPCLNKSPQVTIRTVHGVGSQLMMHLNVPKGDIDDLDFAGSPKSALLP